MVKILERIQAVFQHLLKNIDLNFFFSPLHLSSGHMANSHTSKVGISTRYKLSFYKKKKQNNPSSDQWRVVVTVSAHFSNKVRPGAEGEGKREDTWV